MENKIRSNFFIYFINSMLDFLPWYVAILCNIVNISFVKEKTPRYAFSEKNFVRDEKFIIE